MTNSGHPFEKLFENALKETLADENLVLKQAEKLLEKGYSAKEIFQVLTKLHKSLIQDVDIEVVGEAVDEFSQYVDEE